MGYIRHDAVIGQVSEFDEVKKAALRKKLRVLRSKIKKANLPPLLRGPVEGVNGYEFWFFAPDGSKEGWDESQQADKFRDEFKEIIKSAQYPSLVHIQFGGDDGETRLVETTDGGVSWRRSQA